MLMIETESRFVSTRMLFDGVTREICGAFFQWFVWQFPLVCVYDSCHPNGLLETLKEYWYTKEVLG